ncbi:lasso RiPP family leader peptide-containing protein [Streptomyces sp. NPDC003077]
METRETEMVYQAPELVEVGEFVELTLGGGGPVPESYMTYPGGW